MEPKFQGGAAEADPFSGRSWDTPAAFKSSPCSLQEHPLPPARVGAQFLVTVWLQPPWGHSWDGPARVTPAKGCRGARGGAGPSLVLIQTPHSPRECRWFPSFILGVGWEWPGRDRGTRVGRWFCLFMTIISAEPRLCSWFPGGFSLPGQPETKTPQFCCSKQRNKHRLFKTEK